MRITGETKPSETEAAERSKLSLPVITVEENKEEEKTLMLSSALAELVVVSKEVKKIQLRKGLKRKIR